jgi:diguanylate cyclase (GGDEF)-like protein
MVMNLTTIILYILLLSVVEYIEVYLGNQSTFSYWRKIMTAIKYIIPSLMLAQIIVTFLRLKNIFVFIPALANTALCIISIFTGIVFTFREETNNFLRGPLGYLPFIVCGGYFLCLFIYVLIRTNRQFEDILPILFILFSGVLTFVMPLIQGENFEKWFTTTITISVFVYYVFIVQQLTKKDAMTELLNRQSYYADIEKPGDISSLILLDMNGLKRLNDSEGHEAGDTALKTLGECFRQAAGFGQRVYRIGGDEFAIICRNCNEEAVKNLISDIYGRVEKTKYRCSIGYCMYSQGMSTKDLYIKADECMYKAKQEFYKNHSELDRRKNR